MLAYVKAYHRDECLPTQAGRRTSGQIDRSTSSANFAVPAAPATQARRPLADPAARCAAQASRTQARSQRCAGSASSLGCQSIETVNSGVATGSGKLNISARRFPVCRCGTQAIKSLARASPSAVEKPPTIVTTLRSKPNGCSASSIGPLSSPSRETKMCLPAAKREGVILPLLNGCPIRTAPT